MLTNRINTLSESITIAITTLAQELKAEGKDILSFSAGEPDFNTPQVIKDAAIEAINEGFTKYTAVDGVVELREAIATKLKRDNGLTYAPNQIMVNNGAKHSLFNLFSALSKMVLKL
jgi:aspartate aminotransferase